MFVSRTPRIAIGLLILGYLVAVLILLSGNPYLSISYLVLMAFMGFLTSLHILRQLNQSSNLRVNRNVASSQRSAWFIAMVAFMAAGVLNGAFLVSSFFSSLEWYAAPFSELMVIIFLVLYYMLQGAEDNKNSQRER